MIRCEYAASGARCTVAAEYRVVEAGVETDVCTAHVGPTLSGQAVARVWPLSLTEDGATGVVVAIRQPRPLRLMPDFLRFARAA